MTGKQSWIDIKREYSTAAKDWSSLIGVANPAEALVLFLMLLLLLVLRRAMQILHRTLQ